MLSDFDPQFTSSIELGNFPGVFQPCEALSIRMVPPDSITPHHLHEKVYGKCVSNEALRQSIAEHGVLTPLLVTHDNQVVSGRSRWFYSGQLGLGEVPVCTLPEIDASRVEELVLEMNRNREKSNEQKIREYQEYKRIEKSKAQARAGQRTDLWTNSTGGDDPDKKMGRARDLAAMKVGMSATSAEEGVKVLREFQNHVDSEPEEANELRRILNQKSIHAAVEYAKDAGWLHEPVATGRKKAASNKKKPKAVEPAPEPLVVEEANDRDDDFVEEDAPETLPAPPSPLQEMQEPSGQPSFPTANGFITEEMVEDYLNSPMSRVPVSERFAEIYRRFVALANDIAGASPNLDLLKDIEVATDAVRSRAYMVASRLR